MILFNIFTASCYSFTSDKLSTPCPYKWSLRWIRLFSVSSLCLSSLDLKACFTKFEYSGSSYSRIPPLTLPGKYPFQSVDRTLPNSSNKLRMSSYGKIGMSKGEKLLIALQSDSRRAKSCKPTDSATSFKNSI